MEFFSLFSLASEFCEHFFGRRFFFDDFTVDKNVFDMSFPGVPSNLITFLDSVTNITYAKKYTVCVNTSSRWEKA